MKFLTIIFLLTLFSIFTNAEEKAKITLNEHSMSSTGGAGRPVEISIKFSKGFFNDEPIPYKEKIEAMRTEIDYYQFLEANKIDLDKKITARYNKQKLVDVFNDLMPKVNIKFDGVDPKTTVESFNITNTTLETVLKYLGSASGVYLSYSKTGVLVTSKPN